MTAPLTDLICKDKVWHWSPDCQLAFYAVKRHKTAFSSASVLALLDTDAPFEVIADASGFGLGAIIDDLAAEWSTNCV